MSIWHSVKGLFGQTIHYKDGKKVGETWDGLIPGTYNHYDEHGEYQGYSNEGLFGGTIHHNQDNEYTGSSYDGIFGGKRHYNEHGECAGDSWNGLTGMHSDFEDDYNPIFDNNDDNDF